MKKLQIKTPETASEALAIMTGLKEMFLSGQHDPLEVYARMKAAEAVMKEVLADDQVKEAVMNEASMYPGRTFEHAGAMWQKKLVGVKYDYSSCGDTEYNDMAEYAKVLNERIKKREAFLKALPDNGEVITNQETGETKLVHPPAKTGTESITCTLK